jgi:hypothetical protein
VKREKRRRAEVEKDAPVGQAGSPGLLSMTQRGVPGIPVGIPLKVIGEEIVSPLIRYTIPLFDH